MAKELDRYDTNAKRGIQISTKFLCLIGSSIIASCIIVACVSLIIFNNGFKKNIDETLEKTAYGVNNTIQTWFGDLNIFANLVSDDIELANAMSKNDIETIKRLAKFSYDKMDLDFMVFTDEAGQVIEGTNFDFLANVNLSSNETVKNALNGKTDSTINEIGDRPYSMYAVSPVLKDEVVVGTVITGYDFASYNVAVGEPLEVIVQNSYGVEFTIFKNNICVASTIKDENGKSIVGRKVENEEILNTVLKNEQEYKGTSVINGQGYECVYYPLEDTNGNVTGMWFVAKSKETIQQTMKSTVKNVVPIIIILVVVFIIVCFISIRWLIKRIYNVTNSLKEISTGEADLTKRLTLLARDEIGDLVIQFDSFCDKLQGIIKQIKDTKNELSGAGENLSIGTQDTTSSITQIIANIDGIYKQIQNQGANVAQAAEHLKEISTNINNLDFMIETQSAAVTEAAAAVEQMIGNISSVNNSMDKMANSFKTLSEDAQSGFTKQQDVNERINLIEMQSEMLLEANTTIANIASQTNLLAMNAAIEAAHAGDSGKGFSVVADEIRKLSETSTSQSKTIGEQLNKIKTSISEVVAASTESSKAFMSVSDKIKETDELVMQIKGAMTEQNEGSRQISESLKNMNDSTVEVRTASKNMSNQNRKIMKEMNSLQETTFLINENMKEMSCGAKKINETGVTLGEVSKKVQISIEKIGNQIDLFKV